MTTQTTPEQLNSVSAEATASSLAPNSATKPDPQTTNWFLDKEWINSLQQASMEKLVRMGKGAHHIDVLVRYEGKEYRFEADWIKHLEEVVGRNADIGNPEKR